ncbi:uncharacterized protein LOC134207349 [Armigeres subalbatus]|uniref:uncharacterized protein LOC134207349 n=1 Tax=Armigeres subalbatus TaxID=124917 RepID=UPI002ED2AFF6
MDSWMVVAIHGQLGAIVAMRADCFVQAIRVHHQVHHVRSKESVQIKCYLFKDLNVFLSLADRLFEVRRSNNDDIIILSFNNFKSLARKKIQSAVNTVSEWADNHGFTISPEKSQLLHISKNRKGVSKLPDLSLKNCPIKSQTSLKILGVHLDRTLSFGHHADTVRKSIEKRLQLIKVIGYRIPSGQRATIIRIINGWLLPKMFYGVGLFSRGGDLITKKLRPLYNKAFRYASGVFITSPTSVIISECGQLPFEHFLTVGVMRRAIRWLSLGGRQEIPAEAYALMIASNLTTHITDSPTIIFSDSASCLQEMKSSSSKHPWLQEAERLAVANNVAFCWLPGHSGIHGNEEADRLAGAGREASPEAVSVPSMDTRRCFEKNQTIHFTLAR